MTFCLNAWLVYLRRVRASVDLGNVLATLEKYHVPALLLFICLLLTQSRSLRSIRAIIAARIQEFLEKRLRIRKDHALHFFVSGNLCQLFQPCQGIMPGHRMQLFHQHGWGFGQITPHQISHLRRQGIRVGVCESL